MLARLAVALALLALAPSALAQEPSFPPLTGRVVDGAGIIDAATKQRIEGKLAGLEAKTTTQLVVATLASLGGYDIADYGYRLGRAWGIGQKGANNGAILLVAPNERAVRVEVGYGLEGTLTDAVSRLIIDNSILPRFRAGDFSGGVERGVDDLVQVLSGDAEAFKQRAAERKKAPSDFDDILTFIVILVILFFWMRRFAGSGAYGRGGGPIIFPGGFSRGGGWSGGGSGGGGFSGGGGSFGGGGATGKW